MSVRIKRLQSKFLTSLKQKYPKLNDYREFYDLFYCSVNEIQVFIINNRFIIHQQLIYMKLNMILVK